MLGVALAALAPAAAVAQPAPPAIAPPPSAQPVPSELELAKLIWSTMAMVEHANRSGNYSVLRDTASSGFQINNDPARLTQIFASLRASRLDVSNALLLAPTYSSPPQLIAADVFRVQGFFGLRPTAILFDLYFQWEQGRWKLFGISIEPQALSTVQPGAPSPQPSPQQPPRRRN